MALTGSPWPVDRGNGFTYNFVSSQRSFAEIDKSGEAFGAAMAAMLGNPAGVRAFFHEFDKNLVGTHSEVRRRRPDLSAKMPSGPELRYLDATVIHVRNGYVRDYEEQVKALAAGSKNSVRQPGLAR